MKVNRIMVGLDFTTMDKVLIEYTAFIVYYLKPEVIYFVNIQDTLEIPDDIKASFPDLEGPLDEQLEDDMKLAVERYFPNLLDYKVHFEVVEGNPQKEILHLTRVKEIDLLILGRKLLSHEGGIIPQQLARKVPCSVLFVPEQTGFALRNLLVPIDFSASAQLALDVAQHVASVDKEVQLYAQHVYKVPYGYYKTGKTEGEFAKIMEQHARKKGEEFLAQSNLDPSTVHLHYMLEKKRRSPAHMIEEFVDKYDIDMLLVGAKGKNFATTILLGSVTEKLLSLLDRIPIYIVKDKAQSLSFLKAIDQL